MNFKLKKKIKTYWLGFWGMFSEVSFVIFLLGCWLGLIYLMKLGLFK